MPYIREDQRTLMDNALVEIISAVKQTQLENSVLPVGELNYVVSSILANVGFAHGISYAKCNALVGVLECAKLELYRRVIAPYEAGAIERNGDLPMYAAHKVAPNSEGAKLVAAVASHEDVMKKLMEDIAYLAGRVGGLEAKMQLPVVNIPAPAYDEPATRVIGPDLHDVPKFDVDLSGPNPVRDLMHKYGVNARPEGTRDTLHGVFTGIDGPYLASATIKEMSTRLPLIFTMETYPGPNQEVRVRYRVADKRELTRLIGYIDLKQRKELFVGIAITQPGDTLEIPVGFFNPIGNIGDTGHDGTPGVDGLPGPEESFDGTASPIGNEDTAVNMVVNGTALTPQQQDLVKEIINGQMQRFLDMHPALGKTEGTRRVFMNPALGEPYGEEGQPTTPELQSYVDAVADNTPPMPSALLTRDQVIDENEFNALVFTRDADDSYRVEKIHSDGGRTTPGWIDGPVFFSIFPLAKWSVGLVIGGTRHVSAGDIGFHGARVPGYNARDEIS